MKSGHGRLRRKRTRPGSGISTAATLSLRGREAAPRYRSKENLTSSAVTGSPLWNFTPLRRTNSYTSPSGDTLHDSARLGAMLLPGIGFTRPSWSAYMTMNGVTIIVSAGSKYVGTSVVCTPQVTCPSGAAARPSGAAARPSGAAPGDAAATRTTRETRNAVGSFIARADG